MERPIPALPTNHDYYDFHHNDPPAAPVRILVQDGQPCDIIDHHPELNRSKKHQALIDKAEKREARKRQLREDEAELREHVRFQLVSAGLSGYSPNPDDALEEDVVRERNWDSRRPFDNNPDTGYESFHHACFGWDENPADPDAQEEALAALEGWRGVRGVNLVRLPRQQATDVLVYKCGDQRGLYEAETTHLKAEPITPSAEHIGKEPVAGKKRDYRGVRETASSQAQLVITSESLNSAAAAWMLDPANERARLALTIFRHSEKCYAGQCRKMVGTNKDVIHQRDILQEFLGHLLLKLDAGKYKHQGKIENWIGKCWSRFRASLQEKLYKDVNPLQQRGRDEDGAWQEDDQYFHSSGAGGPAHEVSRLKARQQASRRLQQKLETARQQGLGSAEELMEQMLKGSSKVEAAATLGISERTASRRLETVRRAVSHLKEAA